MTKRIFRSICLAAFIVFIATLVLIMGVLYDYFSDVQQNQLRMQTLLASQGVSHERSDYFNHLETRNFRITWIDETGKVLYDSQSDTAQMENHLERKEIKEAFLQGYGESRRYSVTLLERALYCAQLLEDGTVLRISVTQSTILTLLLGMTQPICIVIFAAIILSVLLALRLSQKIVKPLNELNLDEPLSNKEYDELSPLLKRIDSQQKQLQWQEAELQRRQKELDATGQMRREFTANVSHELKTPLHAISGYAELLKNGLVESKDTIPFAKKIYAEAQRMVQLVEDIIHLSHLDEGAHDMKREKVDLYALAETVMHSLEPEATALGITLKLSGETAIINGIPQLLHSIIYNLCDNAIKYNHKEGVATITVKRDETSVWISVSDTGIGIEPEHQERIFERFYRVDKSHSKEVGGTGLGLSIVKHATKIHNARIDLYSIKDEGTTITVSFPLQ